MRRRLLTIFCITVLISLSATTAFAGALHITGGVRFASSHLNAVGKIAGFGGEGLHEVWVVLRGFSSCGSTDSEPALLSVDKGSVDFNITVTGSHCHPWTGATIFVYDKHPSDSHANLLTSESYTCTTSHKGFSCRRDH